MKRSSLLLVLSMLLCFVCPMTIYAWIFIPNSADLTNYCNDPSVVMIASPGRSGSTMMTKTMQKCLPDRTILKTHILPPQNDFKGKIVFIFSDPDKAAESALHFTLTDDSFWALHFKHLESSDHAWRDAVGGPAKQTVDQNLLSYDALGCNKQLLQWLQEKTTACEPKNAQILAIKYENLWDKETVEALQNFLSANIQLPARYERGCPKEKQDPREIVFRAKHNRGTADQPKYPAYDEARKLWEAAPNLSYLQLK